MHPGLSSLKNAIYKTLCLEKLSVSTMVILISSVFIRFLAMGCIGLAIYFLYGESIVGDAELPALNTITLHSMPLGSFIKRLVHSSTMIFPLEFLLGILGIFATLQKRKSILFVYMCLCMTVIVIYVVLIILWSILYDGVHLRVQDSFAIFHARYQALQMTGEYDSKWQSYYTNLSCCGSTGRYGIQTCRNVLEQPGCYDMFELKMKIYIKTFLCILCIFTVCQVVTIIASDYNLIKLQLKEQNKHISLQKRRILCLKEYGLLPTFWGFLRLVWKRSPIRLLSVVNKSVNLLCGTTLLIVSICFIDSDLVSNWDLIKYFRKIDIYSYNFHSLMAGFGGSLLAIGCLSIGNSIVGFIGSFKQMTLLHTLSFFLSCFLIVMKCIAFVFWTVKYDQIISTIGTQLNGVVNTTIGHGYTDFNVFVNRLMVNFQCCEFDQRNNDLASFCHSDIDDTIVIFSRNYIVDYKLDVYPGFDGFKKCGQAIEERLRLPSGFFFTFLVIGIVSDILAMILISKEHKEGQREKQIQDGVQEKTTSMHLIPWLINIYQKNKPRSTYHLIYIIVTSFMVMLELLFIILTSIFAISSYVERDYIKEFGDLYTFSAISGIILASCCMIGRIIGLVGVRYQLRKIIFVDTAVMVVTTLLSLAYVIIASALRGEEYPCDYQDCSRLESTTGVAIGMFVLEFVMQIIALIIHDRSYQYFLVDTATDEDKIQPGLLKIFYNYLFVDRPIFKHGPKLQRPIAAYSISCAAVLLIEISFVLLVCFYGVSWYADKSWVDRGLYNIYIPTANLGVLFDFLSIGSLVLIPIICMNRFFGISAILKSRKVFLYVNSVILYVTFLSTVIFIGLTSFLLGFLYRCEIKINNVPEPCPHRKTVIVGTALAVFILEIIMQVLSFVVNHKSYGYFLSDVGEPPEQTEIQDTRRGMFTYLYDLVFKRRKPFRNAAKFTVVVAIYVISSLVMLMLEVTFIVLVPIYGLSWVIDRSWVTSGLYSVREGSLNIGLTFDFLAIGLLVLIPIIVLNRFLGIGTVFKRWKKVLYLNFVVLFFTTVLTVIFLVLSSIVLGLDCPPRMHTIVGVAIAMLTSELFMQIFSFFVIDRSHQYCQYGSGEDDESLTETTKQKGMFVTMYEGIFRRREPFIDSQKLEVFIGIHVIAAIVLLMIEVCFIVLVSIYGLSWDRSWITLGLDAIDGSSMNYRQLFDFLAICCLVLVPVICMNRFLGIYAVSTKRAYILYIISAIMLITILVNIICLILASILLYATCRQMDVTVGVGIAMLAVELVMQITSFVVNDRSYKHFKEETGDESHPDGLFMYIIRKYILKRKLLIEFSQLTIPTLVMCIGSTIWLLMEVLFWVGTIIEIGSPRLISGTVMGILYNKSIDNINLGHLADGLGYTAMAFVPLIASVRFAGVYVMLERKSTLLITPAITSVLFCLGCATLIGLSLNHIRYVYNCFGSAELGCDSTTMDIILSVATVYLTFFIIELTIQILQSCLFFYAIKIMIKFSVKKLHLIQTPEKSNRILRYIHIGIRIFEMVIVLMMMLSIPLWLSNLLRLAKVLVIFSLVTLYIVIVNNILSIVAIINGNFRMLIVNTVIVGVCIFSEVVSLIFQAELEDRLSDRAISVYISFTVIQIVCQIIYVVLSVLDIKRVEPTNKVNDVLPSEITNTTTSIIETSNPQLEIQTQPSDDIELFEA